MSKIRYPLDLPIEDLELPPAVTKALQGAEITTYGILQFINENDWLDIFESEVQEALRQHGHNPKTGQSHWTNRAKPFGAPRNSQ